MAEAHGIEPGRQPVEPPLPWPVAAAAFFVRTVVETVVSLRWVLAAFLALWLVQTFLPGLFALGKALPFLAFQAVEAVAQNLLVIVLTVALVRYALIYFLWRFMVPIAIVAFAVAFWVLRSLGV